MNIDKRTIQLPSGGDAVEEGCMLDYNINGYASVSKLTADGWTSIGQSQEPAANIFSFDQKNVVQLFRHKAYQAETTDKGFTVLVPGDCSNVAATTTDEFAKLIKEAVDRKVKKGEYIDPKDLIPFEPKDYAEPVR
jgi:hypothetical protein